MYKVWLLNARSLVNKIDLLAQRVSIAQPDIIMITETWANSSITEAELCIQNYQLFRADRATRGGGGVACYVKDAIECCQLKNAVPSSPNEALWLKTTFGLKTVLIGTFYRPPNSTVEQDKSLAKEILLGCKRPQVSSCVKIIGGDFNMPSVDWKNGENIEVKYKAFKEAFRELDFEQVVLKPTHIQGNILDLIFTSDTSIIQKTITKEPIGQSDHFVVESFLQCGAEKPHVKCSKRRNYRKADWKKFKEKIEEMNWIEAFQEETVDAIWLKFKNILNDCLDKTVPWKTTREKYLSKPEWWTRKIDNLKNKKRRAFKAMKKHPKNPLARRKYKEVAKLFVKEIKKGRAQHEKDLAEKTTTSSVKKF